jgi:tetratricopeptide (TPR) repeat protein
MVLRRLPVFLLLLALGALPGNAQSQQQRRHGNFSIGGSLRDSVDHHGMENVLVTLKLLTGPTVNTAYTRSNGDFQFDGLTEGDYILEIVVKDYDTFRETISIDQGSRLGMAVFLNKTGKAAIPTSQLSISAHQLSVPHKAHDEFEKGMALIYLKSDYRGAIVQFQLAIKDFPTYYEAYAEEGGAYYQLKDLEPAEEALRKSIELSSGQYADASFSLAALFNDTKRFADAEAAARKGISTDKSSWRGPFELARALTALKQTDDAEKSAEESRDLMPDNPPVYLLLANIHIQKKDYPSLVTDLDEYLRLAPNTPEADQARKTREKVQAMLNAPKGDSAEGGQDKSQDDDDDDDPAADKNAPSSEPRPAALPSLPPPTAGNQ